MAGDWIKMRGSLISSPKLIRFARELHALREFREWLTPGGSGPMNGQIVSDHALRAVALSLLNVTWCASREHGTFDGDDLILEGIEIDDLDSMAGAPGVGAAMNAVGWAVEVDDGNAVSLPNFREYNAPATPAERMAKSRSGRVSLEPVAQMLRDERNGSAQNVAHRQRSETETDTKYLSSEAFEKSKVSQVSARIGETATAPAVSDLSESDLLEISEEEVERAAPLADSLFRRSKYTGDDGALLWKIAVLVGRRIVPENLAHDAAEGAKMNAKKNPVGFVRKALAETCAKRGIDLDREVARLKLPRGSPKSRPQSIASEELRALTSGIGAMK